MATLAKPRKSETEVEVKPSSARAVSKDDWDDIYARIAALGGDESVGLFVKKSDFESSDALDANAIPFKELPRDSTVPLVPTAGDLLESREVKEGMKTNALSVPSGTNVHVVSTAPSAPPALITGNAPGIMEDVPIFIAPKVALAPPLLLGTSRARLSLRHVHIEREYDLRRVRLAQNMAAAFLKDAASRPRPSKFSHYIGEYIKSEKTIDELLDTIEVLKGVVNEKVASSWVLRTAVDRQSRLDLDEEDRIESSIKYVDASIDPEIRKQIELALRSLRRCRTTELSRAVNDRQHTQFWVEQTLDSNVSGTSFLYVVEIGCAFLRSLANVLKSHTSVSATLHPKHGSDGPWQCRAAKKITSWVRHAAAWLIRFGTWENRLDMLLQVARMPGVSSCIRRDSIGHKALLGIVQFPQNGKFVEEEGSCPAINDFYDERVQFQEMQNSQPPPLDPTSDAVSKESPVNTGLCEDERGTRVHKLTDPWGDDDLLDHFISAVALVLHHPGAEENSTGAVCPQPDVLHNNPLSSRMTRLISGRNESFSEDDSSNISKVPLDIFNVGTGTGTERTNWLIVSDGDDESIRSASAETSVDSKRVSTTGRNARLNSRPNCVIMSDDDMVAVYEQLPVDIACKALFAESRLGRKEENGIRVVFSRAASLIRLHGQALYEFALSSHSRYPRFCKVLAETIVNIVSECTLRVTASGEAAALIESLCLLTVHELQRCRARHVRLYLTRLPYHSCSPNFMWRVMIAVYLGTDSAAVRFACIDGRATGTSIESNTKGTPENTQDANQLFLLAIAEGVCDKESWYNMVKKYPGVRSSLIQSLSDTTTFDECARLSTLADIAEAHGGDIAAVIFEELYYAGHIAVESRSIWHTQIVSLLANMAMYHPQLISSAIHLVNNSIEKSTAPMRSMFYLVRHLERPIVKWKPQPAEFKIIRSWLLFCQKQANSANEPIRREIAQLIIDSMNWGKVSSCDDRLFLSVELHRECAITIAEAMSTMNNQEIAAAEAKNVSYVQQVKNMVFQSDVDKFEAWAFSQVQKFCLCNNYTEMHHPRIPLLPNSEGDAKAFEQIHGRVIALFQTQQTINELIASESYKCDVSVGAVSAYVLLLSTDCIHHGAFGWHIWATLVHKQHLFPALRVLHDMSPVFFRFPIVIAEMPLETLRLLMNLSQPSQLSLVGQLLPNIFTKVPYGVQCFASVVAAQSDYGAMWLEKVSGLGDVGTNGDALGVLGEYGHYFVMEALLKSATTKVSSGRMLPLEEAFDWMSKMLLKTNQNNTKIHNKSKGVIETFMGWGKASIELLNIFGMPSGPTHPYISFVTLLLDSFKQRKILACLTKYFDSNMEYEKDRFVETVSLRILASGSDDEKTVWNNATDFAFDASTDVSSLAIVEWAKLCLVYPDDDVLLPIVWQCFFSLFLSHVKDADRSSSLGLWLFHTYNKETNKPLLKQLGKRLCSIVKKYTAIVATYAPQQESSADSSGGIFTEDKSNEATTASINALEAKKLASLFAAMFHWLEDAERIDCSAIHTLPSVYCPGRLASFVLSSNPLCEHHASVQKVLKLLWWDAVKSVQICSGQKASVFSGSPDVEWMPYARAPPAIVSYYLPPRSSKYRTAFLKETYSTARLPPYRVFQPILPWGPGKINLKDARPETYTRELVELAKRFSKALSQAIDIDNHLLNLIDSFWVRQKREMRRRKSDKRGRMYEFVFTYMDSVFNKDSLSKARSVGIVCDTLTLKVAETDCSANKIEDHDRVQAALDLNSSELLSSTSRSIVAIMTIEAIVGQLESSELDVFTTDQISNWFYHMLRCDRDNESWTRKCEYTRDFIWRMVKRLASLWLTTRPSIEERNSLLILLTESIPATATNEKEGPVFTATIGILQDLLKMHFEDHLPYVLRVLVGNNSAADGQPMNERVWRSIINVPKWTKLLRVDECAQMLGSGVMQARLLRRDSNIAALSKNEYELVNDMINVWDQQILNLYLLITERLFLRSMHLVEASIVDSWGLVKCEIKMEEELSRIFCVLVNPWTNTITLPADESTNQRAILQHPWPLNGEMNTRVKSFLVNIFTNLVNKVNKKYNGQFLVFLWKWIGEQCTPLEYTADTICTLALEVVDWSNICLDREGIETMLSVLHEHHSEEMQVSWMHRLTLSICRKVNWEIWKEKLSKDPAVVDQILSLLLRLFLFIDLDWVELTSANIPWRRLSTDSFHIFLSNEYNVLHSRTCRLLQAAAEDSTAKVSFFLRALGKPLGSSYIDTDDYVSNVSSALELVRRLCAPDGNGGAVGEDREMLVRNVLEWVDNAIMSNTLEEGITYEKRTISVREHVGRLIWCFLGESSYLASTILDNASIVLSLPYLALVNERALWGYQHNFGALDGAEVHVPNFDTAEFVNACVSKGCVLTLYTVAKQLENKQFSGSVAFVTREWERKMHETIADWLRRLPCVVDARINPLTVMFISKSDVVDPNNERNGLWKTLQVLKGMYEKAFPSLFSRVATYVSGQDQSELLNWGNDPNAQHSTVLLFQSAIESLEKIFECKNQNGRAALLKDFISKEGTTG